MSDVKPTLLSQKMASQALADISFFSKVPEFLSLKAKLAVMKADLEKPRGCSGCRRRRVVKNLYREFMDIFIHLNDDGVRRMKGYYGVQKFMVHAREKATGKAIVKIL
jgi:hypothetical protein